MRLGTSTRSIAGLVVIIGALAMLLSACGGQSTIGSGQAPKDKQIVKPLDSGPNVGDIDTFDPGQTQFAFDYDKDIMIYPQLVTLTDDLKVVDSAAQSHEVSADGLTYTFHLHSNMKWSDGTPIDATSFAYAINRALDPCFVSQVSYYNLNIKGATAFNSKTCDAGPDGLDKTSLIGQSIVAADPQTLKVTLEAPAAYFLSEMTYPTYFAVPKQLIDKYGQTKWTDHLADGSGLGGSVYRLTRWDKAGHLEFTANDSFSLGQAGDHPARQLHAVQRRHHRVRRLQVGRWRRCLALPRRRGHHRQESHGSTYHQSSQLGVQYIEENWALAPFDDVRVRNAFSLAIDRNAIATTVYKGLVLPTIHMMINGLPGYNPDLKNAAGDSGDKALTANVAKAQELAKAYAADKCGGDFSKCTPIVYTYRNNSSTWQLLAQVLQQEWQTAFPGWNITLQSIDRSIELKTYGKLQIADESWGADYPDSQDFLSLLWTKPAQYNQTFVNVPAADALCAKADINPNQTERYQQYQQAEQLWVDQGAFASFGQRVYYSVVKNTISGMTVNGSGTFSLSNWETSYVKA